MPSVVLLPPVPPLPVALDAPPVPACPVTEGEDTLALHDAASKAGNTRHGMRFMGLADHVSPAPPRRLTPAARAGVTDVFPRGYLPLRPACPCNTTFPSVVAVAALSAVRAFATLRPVTLSVGVDSA